MKAGFFCIKISHRILFGGSVFRVGEIARLLPKLEMVSLLLDECI